jgi:hypothetical protein
MCNRNRLLFVHGWGLKAQLLKMLGFLLFLLLYLETIDATLL